MKMNYRYKLKLTAEQNATMIEWLNCCRNQYNYRLGERFRWWETTRTTVNACPLTASIVPIEKIYQNIPEYRVQVRDGRKKDNNGNPITKKGDKHPNIVNGYVQWQAVQLADLKNTKKLFPRYKKLHSQVLQDVINRVETAFSNFIKPNKNGERSGKPRFKGLHYYKSFRKNKPKPDGKGGFLPNNQAQSRGMNKSWIDAGHSAFVAILEWVAWKRGKRIIKVDPWGTSQFCHACLNKVPKELKDRWHSCSCGASLNRDENSAKLIKSVGLGLALRKTAPRGKEARSLCDSMRVE